MWPNATGGRLELQEGCKAKVKAINKHHISYISHAPHNTASTSSSYSSTGAPLKGAGMLGS